MECDICMMEWDFLKRTPRLLSCGHTFCESCLISVLEKSIQTDKNFLCPNCMSIQKEIREIEDIKKLMKNFNLLRIVDKIESSRSRGRTSRSNRTSNSFLKGNYGINPNDFEFKENKQFIRDEIKRNNSDRNSICKKHSLPIHSYAIGTNLLFCGDCEKETNLKTYPLPNVIKELKKKCDYNQVKIVLLKNEVERIRDFFDSYQEEFESTSKQKIEELLNYLKKVITYHYNTAMDISQQCKLEQNAHIQEKLKELELLECELNACEKEMIFINNLDNKELINQSDKLERMQFKLSNYINYELELDLLTIVVKFPQEIKETLFTSIQDAFSIDVDYMQIRGDNPTIKQILQKEKYWGCICGEINNLNSEVKCFTCGNFRRLETFENFYTDALKVSQEYIDLVNLRRKIEGKDFKDLVNDRTNTKDSGSCNYYALDLEWFLQWKSFILNDLSEKILPQKKICIIKDVGVIAPGQISNLNLFEKNSQLMLKNLKKGLKKNEDYVVVNEKVWKMFLYNYNGGPEIVLNRNDEICKSVVSISEFHTLPYQILKEILNYLQMNTSSNLSHDREEECFD